jgi:hypothetical protein
LNTCPPELFVCKLHSPHYREDVLNCCKWFGGRLGGSGAIWDLLVVTVALGTSRSVCDSLLCRFGRWGPEFSKEPLREPSGGGGRLRALVPDLFGPPFGPALGVGVPGCRHSTRQGLLALAAPRAKLIRCERLKVRCMDLGRQWNKKPTYLGESLDF